ncbi:ADP-ribosylglycohydrolase family protein [Streptomyces sp. NRRL B-24484]|uniref:ADP-ribosylglycohydrolase family protein n=1 Tax=Streptomyces sp. NRRL B-24484 TaxID=1463833 RepID=UPI0004BE584A|nr:ADP-ribosylglycohydrolase family protein [Streptomyces sp. NRRL B-24484]
MGRLTWQETAAYRARLRGCLLGGAIGDALGNPIEMKSMVTVEAEHGPTGITGLVPDRDGVIGRITDDTQMTLFSAEGWMYGYRRIQTKGIGGAETALIKDAYLRWLETQRHPAPLPHEGLRHRIGDLREQLWLYARRAPGRACEFGLQEDHTPDAHAPVDGSPGPVNPDSKGCGSVMRSAPFGFTGAGISGDGDRHAFELAARCSRITHGHPTAQLASGAFAAMISRLVDGASLPDAVRNAMELLTRYPGHQETHAALQRAVALAEAGPATPLAMESLGGGWTAEEALAMGVYAALARTEFWKHRTPIESALLLAVNHSGDSDSTGSICGNLLGAHHGDAMLPPDWLARIEGRAAIAVVADDFAAVVHPGEKRPWVYSA